MYFVFEISKPFQALPDFYRSNITLFRIVWLWFALSMHPGRYDQMLKLALSGNCDPYKFNRDLDNDEE